MQRILFLICGCLLLSAIIVSCFGGMNETRRKANDRAYKKTVQTEFNDPAELEKNWTIEYGEWKIENGALVAEVEGVTRAIAWFNKPLMDDIEIEYEAKAVRSGSDLNCIVAGNGETWSGLEIMIGGEGGQKSGISLAHINEMDHAAKDVLNKIEFNLQKGKTYRITVRRKPDMILVYVDGEEIFRQGIRQFPHDMDSQFFALSTWDNEVHFLNLSIENKAGEESK